MARGYFFGNEVIDNALMHLGFDRSYYNIGASHFMSVMRDYKLFHVAQEKESWLNVNSLNYTVQYPDDAIRITDVGVSINREFFPFTEASEMVKPSDPIGRELLTSRSEADNIQRNTTGYSAQGLNVEYYYHLDDRKRRIILNRAAVDKTRYADRNEVLVKFVSNDVDNLSETRVGMDAVNMIMAYIEWKLVSNRPKEYSANYIESKRRDFLEAEASYRLLNIPDVGELMDAIYETSGQNIRF